MTLQRFFLSFLVALVFSLAGVQGRIFTPIDTFNVNPGTSLFHEVATHDAVNNYWYSPYNPAFPPGAIFQNTPNALGGQRDLICGHQSQSIEGASANIAIQPVPETCNVAISLGYFGSCYIQWDGDDTGGSPGTPFPGAVLSSTPGIGSGGNPFGVGASMDFTFGGFATAITSTIIADHNVFYYYNVFDASGAENELVFFTLGGEDEYKFDAFFDSPDWTNPAFDWTTVVAFQVRVQTAEASGTSNTAVDTSFKFLNIVGYEIKGDVVVDCTCAGTTVNPVPNASVNIFNDTSNQLLGTDTTDATGAWSFLNARAGSYRVCLGSSLTLCSSSPQCVQFTLVDFIDPPQIRFATTVTTSITVPASTTIACGACETVACLGNAVENGCNGQIDLTPTETITGDVCRKVITRTWTTTDGSRTGTQTINVVDNTAPTLTTPASNGALECGMAGETIEQWVARNAGAQATDCNTVTWTNNFNTGPAVCGAVPVVFTATDPCGLSVTTSATFSITDTSAPVPGTPPSDSAAPCDSKGTSVQDAYNQWVANHGGATASDNCDTDLTWTPAAPAIQNGCAVTQTVTWAIRDDCGNTVSVTAIFRVTDNQAPVITTQATGSTVQCTSGSGVRTALQSWVNSRGGAQATDNCIANDNSLTWTNDWDGEAIPQSCGGGLPVTFTVRDPCGLTATTQATFSVTDDTPPTITRPASGASAQCSNGDGSVNAAFQAWLTANGNAQATDDCSAISWTNNAGTAPANGCAEGVTVTFSVQDACNGQAVSTTATFSVSDTAAPTITTPPANSQADCVTDVDAAFQQWLATAGGATATDNCGTASFTNDFTGTSGPNRGCNALTPVRFTAVDLCGLRSSAVTATFTVTDTTPPTITSPATPLALQCDATNLQSYRDWLAANGNAQATDSCGTVTWSNNGPASLTAACTTSQTVVFTARDTCGMSVTTSASVSITDTVAPQLTTPASDSGVECSANAESGFQSWLNTRGGAQATDNCGGITWSNNWVDGSWVDTGCVRTAAVVFTASDPCGNSITTNAQYVISNTQPPTISSPARPLTVECDGSTGQIAFDNWVASHGGATATDACTAAANLQWSNTAAQSPTGCSNAEVTFTVTDPCGGSASTTALFNLVDTTRPTFTTQPTDPRVECDGAGNVSQYQQWLASFGGAVATDKCAFAVTLTINAPTAGPVGCGVVPATVTAADECGNSASVTTSFSVVDTTAPTFAPGASNQGSECSSNNDAELQAWLASHGGAQAVDTCYPQDRLVWTNNFTSLVGSGCGRAAVVGFTVTDGCGQRAVTTASFSITDSIPPTLNVPASPAVFECVSSGNTGQINSWVASNGGASASDSCSAVSWTNDFTTPPTPCAGPVTVTFTASDACGNLVITSSTVAIADTLVPEFTNFPTDKTLLCNDPTDSSATGRPGATDQCDTDVDITESDSVLVNPPEGFCPGDTIITRTWSLVDNCGNFNVRDQVIVITIPSGPCIPQPCPPCENEPECCASSMEPQLCNPVPCNPVPCRGGVGCLPVACLPVECNDECEPIYIYVFDDDDNTSFETSFNASSASKNVFSVFLMVVLALALLI